MGSLWVKKSKPRLFQSARWMSGTRLSAKQEDISIHATESIAAVGASGPAAGMLAVISAVHACQTLEESAEEAVCPRDGHFAR